MKKLSILGAIAALPFLIVWAGFILTAFSYSPRDVFQSGAFWGLSCMYWFLYICLIGLIVELLDDCETEQPKSLSKEEMIQKHLNGHPNRQDPQYEAFVRDVMNKLS